MRITRVAIYVTTFCNCTGRKKSNTEKPETDSNIINSSIKTDLSQQLAKNTRNFVFAKHQPAETNAFGFQVGCSIAMEKDPVSGLAGSEKRQTFASGSRQQSPEIKKRLRPIPNLIPIKQFKLLAKAEKAKSAGDYSDFWNPNTLDRYKNDMERASKLKSIQATSLNSQTQVDELGRQKDSGDSECEIIATFNFKQNTNTSQKASGSEHSKTRDAYDKLPLYHSAALTEKNRPSDYFKGANATAPLPQKTAPAEKNNQLNNFRSNNAKALRFREAAAFKTDNQEYSFRDAMENLLTESILAREVTGNMLTKFFDQWYKKLKKNDEENKSNLVDTHASPKTEQSAFNPETGFFAIFTNKAMETEKYIDSSLNPGILKSSIATEKDILYKAAFNIEFLERIKSNWVDSFKASLKPSVECPKLGNLLVALNIFKKIYNMKFKNHYKNYFNDAPGDPQLDGHYCMSVVNSNYRIPENKIAYYSIDLILLTSFYGGFYEYIQNFKFDFNPGSRHVRDALLLYFAFKNIPEKQVLLEDNAFMILAAEKLQRNLSLNAIIKHNILDNFYFKLQCISQERDYDNKMFHLLSYPGMSISINRVQWQKSHAFKPEINEVELRKKVKEIVASLVAGFYDILDGIEIDYECLLRNK